MYSNRPESLLRRPAALIGAALARFARDVRGAGTVFSLGLLFLAALFGGLAVDVGNAWRYNELLKTTADVAARAGAVVLAQGGTPEEAEEAALRALDYNMPEAHYGRILAFPAEAIRPVFYDAETNEIGPGDEDQGVNAIAVRVERSAATGNPVPTMLLRLAGSKAWDLAGESVVALVPTRRCRSTEGLYARGLVMSGPGAHVGADVCLHAQERVIPGEGSWFEEGAGLSMPDLSRCGSNCTDSVSQGAEAARFEANLIRPDLGPLIQNFRSQLTAPLSRTTLRQNPARDAYFARRPLPEDLSALDEVGVPIDRLKTGMVVEMSPAAFTRLRAVPQGLVYRVMCSDPPAGKALPGASIPVPVAADPEGAGREKVLVLSGNDLNGNPIGRIYRNLVLISDCQIRLDPSAQVEGAVILSLRSKDEGAGYGIVAESGARIGDPDGSCSPDHRTTLLSEGSVLVPAGVFGTNVGVVAGGDIRISPAQGVGGVIYGVTGLGLHAGGNIGIDVTHDFSACAAGAEPSPDPFVPDLKVLRQVEPTAPPPKPAAQG